MFIANKISKLLGEENLNLRLENFILKKKSKNNTNESNFLDFSKKNFISDVKSELIFLKIIIITKKLENFYKNFYLICNSKSSTNEKTINESLFRDFDVKFNNVSILLKHFQTIFFRLKNIFVNFSVVLFPIRKTMVNLKRFFHDLLVIDFLSHYKKKYLKTLDMKILPKKSFISFFPPKISLKHVRKLRQKLIFDKRGQEISLKFFQNSKKKKKKKKKNSNQD